MHRQRQQNNSCQRQGGALRDGRRGTGNQGILQETECVSASHSALNASGAVLIPKRGDGFSEVGILVPVRWGLHRPERVGIQRTTHGIAVPYVSRATAVSPRRLTVFSCFSGI